MPARTAFIEPEPECASLQHGEHLWRPYQTTSDVCVRCGIRRDRRTEPYRSREYVYTWHATARCNCCGAYGVCSVSQQPLGGDQ